MNEPTTNQTLDIEGTIYTYTRVAWKLGWAVAFVGLGIFLWLQMESSWSDIELNSMYLACALLSFIIAASLAFSKQTYIYLDFTDRQIVTVEHYAWIETSKRCRPLTEAQLTEAQLTEAQKAPKFTKVGWAIQVRFAILLAFKLACLLLTAAGSLAVQAGWMCCEWPWIFDALFVLQVGAIVLEDIFLTPKRKAEPGAAPNSGPTTPSGSSGVAGGPPSVS